MSLSAFFDRAICVAISFDELETMNTNTAVERRYFDDFFFVLVAPFWLFWAFHTSYLRVFAQCVSFSVFCLCDFTDRLELHTLYDVWDMYRTFWLFTRFNRLNVYVVYYCTCLRLLARTFVPNKSRVRGHRTLSFHYVNVANMFIWISKNGFGEFFFKYWMRVLCIL
jgi:hypothetical protein